MKDRLLSRIHDHTAVIAVVGMGYVGLPLAVAFAEKGFPVIGIDVDGNKMAALNRGESYVQDISSVRLAGIIGQKDDDSVLPSPGRLIATTDFGVLAHCDAVIIAVPTPLSKTRDPDMKYVLAAGKAVAQYIHPGMLVVLESTTYPGTTEELLLPILVEGSGLKVGEELFVAFSPERIDPGNKQFVVENTPKVVGGVTPACQEVAVTLYAQAIERVVPVSSTQAAEMVKLLENTFRAVNIALVNEVAIMCAEQVVDRTDHLVGGATHRLVHRGRVIRHGYRRSSLKPCLHDATHLQATDFLVAVLIAEMDIHTRDAILDSSQAVLHDVRDPMGQRLAAVDVVVGTYQDLHCSLRFTSRCGHVPRAWRGGFSPRTADARPG